MAFQKGQSGNRAGRPVGIPDKRTQFRDHLSKKAPEIIQAVITAALAGDMGAARICLDRICPSLKAVSLAEPINIDFSGSPSQQSQNVLDAVSEGRISVDEAVQLLAGIASHMKVLEITLLSARLDALEQNISEGGRP